MDMISRFLIFIWLPPHDQHGHDELDEPVQDAQDELDEPMDDNLSFFIFQLIWLYQVAAKWHIKQDNSDQVGENLYNYLFKLLL
jgi:hypothetical protein